jgi:hypothetical protein
MRRSWSSAVALLSLALVPATAHAATVRETAGQLRVTAAPGETNAVDVAPTPDGLWLLVTDGGASPVAQGPGCAPNDFAASVICPADGVKTVVVRTGDRNDSVDVAGALPARIDGGAGDDTLLTDAGDDVVVGGTGRDRISTGLGADQAIGNPGGDTIDAGPGDDRVSGGDGDDELHGGEGDDRMRGNAGADIVDGGPGDDLLFTRDASADTTWCGDGDDEAQADTRDWLDPCESVDYGPSGLVGRIYTRTGGGRFVRIPGQAGEWLDRRLLDDLAYFVRRYHVRVTDGYSRANIHAARGEHPLGLAVDLVPGPGGTWDDVDRLAKWAEPRQNHPRWPFRWVGYNGDYNHGRGNHLHLSWAHSTGRAGTPVHRVWLFTVRRGKAGAAAASAGPPSRYVAPAPQE